MRDAGFPPGFVLDALARPDPNSKAALRLGTLIASRGPGTSMGDQMISGRRFLTTIAMAGPLGLLGACSSAGSVGDILGSVLGQQQQGNQVSGAILGVDTRAHLKGR